jgi:hypothetical protein
LGDARWRGLLSRFRGMGANVYEIDLKTLNQRVIPMPDPVFAGSIAADESSGVIWVANCGCPRS